MKRHLETILAILYGIEPGADRDRIYFEIGRAIGEARLALINLSIKEKQNS